METMTHATVQESPLMEASFDETAARLGLSPQHIETFLTKVNSQIEGEGLGAYDGDMLVALIDLYVTDNKHPERIDVMVSRLLNVLSDKIEPDSEATFYEDLMYVRDHMSKILAQRFEIIRDSRVDPNEFSAMAVYNFRQLIDPDENFFQGSLDTDEVSSLIQLYALSRLNYQDKRKGRPLDPRILERQLLKLTSYLKGRRRIDIQNDFYGEGTNDLPNVMNILKKKLAWFALHPDDLQILYEIGVEEFKDKIKSQEVEPPEEIAPAEKNTPEPIPKSLNAVEVTTIIGSFLDSSILPKDHRDSFKSHIGFSEPAPMGTIKQRDDACEEVRELVANASRRDRGKYNVIIDNLPTQAQLQVVKRLLGNRHAALSPVSRSALVAQYGAELQQQCHTLNIDGDIIQKRITRYGELIDQALAQTLDWATSPKYRYDTEKPVEESA